ncbi:hypothetical protein BDK51DRAFT_41985 [Blyttiomyces helicus]|uniref:F-box domain-containing protein n=1 Tax=Blyttiomyces helicus TaxID=388810 RepID=A0A4V1ISN6_9FUNG|nr:hypothetical protein BDK51DRAFT_41985 [Blyttiomyces helicus]|eukprot:RKO94187.1 hypothetical protein BDK51DRAFT_41985 [Blyttiomyces helicus]
MRLLGAHRIGGALGGCICYLREDVRGPGVRQLLLLFSDGAGHGAGREHPVPRLHGTRSVSCPQAPARALLRANSIPALLLVDIVRRLNVSSPGLIALDLTAYLHSYGTYADLKEIASTIARLEFLSIPCQLSQLLSDNLLAATSPALRSWVPEDSSLIILNEPATSLSHLIEFSAFAVSASHMNKLAVLRPPLRRLNLFYAELGSESSLAALLAACPSIRELDLGYCTCDGDALTDKTLTALADHPPLFNLNLAGHPPLTASAPASFLQAQGSDLCYLDFDWLGPAPFAAIATHAQNIHHIIITIDNHSVTNGVVPAFDWEIVQFVKDLVLACPRLQTFAPRWATTPDMRAFLAGCGLRHEGVADVNPFEESMYDAARFAGVGRLRL